MRKTLTAATIFVASVLLSSMALADEQITPLLKQNLEGMDGKEANVVLFEVEPGFETERHIHPGHLFIYVLEGTIEIDLEGRDEPIRIAAGEAAYEPANTPMVGRNASSTEGARFVVFQVGEAGEPLMVAQPE
jgi:quercetin dioxygenase-like cupin family protein